MTDEAVDGARVPHSGGGTGGVRSGRVENDEEDEDLDDDGDYDGPTKDDSAVLPSENSDTIDIENGKARQEKAALQELIASLETRRAAGVTT